MDTVFKNLDGTTDYKDAEGRFVRNKWDIYEASLKNSIQVDRVDNFAMAALPMIIKHYEFQDPDGNFRIDPMHDQVLNSIANDAMKLGYLMANWKPAE